MDTALERTPLLVDWFRQTLEAKGRSPHTVANNLRGVREFIEYLKAEEKKIQELRDVDQALLTRYQSFLFRSPKRLKLTTQLGLLIALRNFFRFLEHENLILRNPAHEMELPRKPRTLPLDTLSEGEMKKLLKAVDLDKQLGLRDRAILELLYSTGIRAGELSKLKCRALDPGSAVLRIRQGKGGRDRVVTVGEVALHYLMLYLQEERPKLLTPSPLSSPPERGRGQGEGGDTLFLTRKGQAMSGANPTEIVKTCAVRAGIKRPTNAHMIRRSCATHMLKRQAPIRYIQELLGHNSLDTTQRYTRVVISDLKRIHHKTHPRELD